MILAVPRCGLLDRSRQLRLQDDHLAYKRGTKADKNNQPVTSCTRYFTVSEIVVVAVTVALVAVTTTW